MHKKSSYKIISPHYESVVRQRVSKKKNNAFQRKITKVGPHIGMEDGKNTQHSQSAGRFPRFFPHLRAKQSSSSSTNLTNCARQNQHFKSAMIFLSRESILGRTNLDCLHTEIHLTCTLTCLLYKTMQLVNVMQ